MLPFSIMESKRFKEFMAVFDPSFVVPTRPTAKGTGVGSMYAGVDLKIKALINSMKWVNVSVDGWSDATIRCFNGYIVQGIDSNWKLHTLAIAFQHVIGKHTGQAIKAQFDVVSKEFGINNKVFKIVADQAANVKKAFAQTEEAVDVITIATDLVKRQIKLDLIKQQEEEERIQQEKNKESLENSIEEANTISPVNPTKITKKRTADELLEDFDNEFEFDEFDEETEELDESDLLDQTDCDEDENFDEEDDPLRLAYEPCAAHNIQLVLKDAFLALPHLNDLIIRLSKNIVSKSKFSALIAEELRNFGKKFAKRAVTRWNSILFTARSLIGVTSEQYKKIRDKMPTLSKKQKAAKSAFVLTAIEREMLEELVFVLEWFEWVTDEFQTNHVSVSRVYPCVSVLRHKLSDVAYLKDQPFVHMEKFCAALLESLDLRFGKLIKSEVRK